jgi:hypothetical protein
LNEELFIEKLIETINDVLNPLSEEQVEANRDIIIPVSHFPNNPKEYEMTHPIGNLLIKSGQTTAKTGGMGISQRPTAYQSKLYLMTTMLNGSNGLYEITAKILDSMDGKNIGVGKPYFKLISEPVFIDNGSDGFWERVITFVVPGVKIP